MTIAAIYDIHGNLPALEAVVEEIRACHVTEIIVGGDVVPGPLPKQTFDFIRSLDIPTRFIHGNGDRAVLDVLRGNTPTSVPATALPLIEWTASQLSSEHERLIASWDSMLTMDVAGIGKVTFCHATPRNDTEIFTRETRDEKLMPVFENAAADVVVCGHTHMQFDRIVGTTRVVNAGSVGMPFGEPGAYWLLLDNGLKLKRTDYDLEKAARRIRGSDYPQAELFAAENVLNPPSEDTILAVYRKTELT